MTATSPTPVRPAAAPRRHPAPHDRRVGTFHGTGALLRLALRRDRILLPLWILGFAAMVAFSVTATKDLYPTEQSLVAAADLINATAALIALYGKIYAATSLGAVSLIKMTAFGAALVAILFVFITVRHSRAEEETGRLELVAAGAVGRAAPLTAAVVLGVGASLALGVVTTAGLAAVGLPMSGCISFGLGWAMTGMVFTAIAAVAAQITTSARAAISLGLITVGVAYALRAVGDLAAADPGVLSWLSPIGWSQQIRPFAGDRWWVAAIPLAATVALVAVAFLLRSRRDLGSGFLPDRLGPAIGRIDGVPALAWRLQRGMFTTWLVAAAVMGLVLGSVAHNVSGFFDSPQMKQYLVLLGGEQGLTDAFLAAEVGLLGAIVAGYAIAATLRMRSEESAGHAELLLSTATTRITWAASHLVLALLGSAAVLLAAGSAIGLAHGLAVGDPVGQSVRIAAAAAAQIPAVWVMAALAFLLFGWVPLAAPAIWALYVGFIVLGEFGQLWQLPQWVLDVSPFAHSPTLPGGAVEAGQLALLIGAAVVIVVAGAIGWRRRDLGT